MQSVTLVSFILLFYREKSFQVERAIKSAINQTYENLEIIIILDDPLSENIIKIVNRYCQLNKKLKFYINDKNLGIPQTRNRAIKLARGKYIAFLDGDDECLPERITLQIEFMDKNPMVDISGTGIVWKDESNPKNIFWIQPNRNISEVIKRYCPVVQGSMITLKDNFQKYGYYNELKRTSEDYDLMLRWYLKGAIFDNLSDYLVTYYRDISGQNANIRQETIDGIKTKLKYRKILNLNFKDYFIIFLYEIPFFILLPRKVVNKLVFFVNQYIRKNEINK